MIVAILKIKDETGNWIQTLALQESLLVCEDDVTELPLVLDQQEAIE